VGGFLGGVSLEGAVNEMARYQQGMEIVRGSRMTQRQRDRGSGRNAQATQSLHYKGRSTGKKLRQYEKSAAAKKGLHIKTG